ncbi:MAG: RNA methyltransferase [Vicinamibacterales bacterium]|nr:RNA methyltransferase [Vicinamibacterales bacterium]
MRTITSRQHAMVGRFRAAAARPSGTADLLIDGPHLVRDALAAGVTLDTVATTAAARETAEIAAIIDALATTGTEVVSVSEPVMGALSPVRTPTGIVAIGQGATATLSAVLARQPALVVALFGVQDPGNVGAVIRAADAAGATGIVVLDGCASPFGWKALRGAMGSTFRVPTCEGIPLAETLSEARRAGVLCLAAVPSGAPAHFDCDLRRPALLLMGGEGPGLDAAALAAADGAVCIPMAPGVESLNVAVAAGVLLFEARRQRSFSDTRVRR